MCNPIVVLSRNLQEVEILQGRPQNHNQKSIVSRKSLHAYNADESTEVICVDLTEITHHSANARKMAHFLCGHSDICLLIASQICDQLHKSQGILQVINTY